jgi:hypothetical protein
VKGGKMSLIPRFRMKSKWEAAPAKAISLDLARLCLNCDNIIQEKVCPVCFSTNQLRVVQFIGSTKLTGKRFLTKENGDVKIIYVGNPE